jgi:hypothetical protein
MTNQTKRIISVNQPDGKGGVVKNNIYVNKVRSKPNKR